MKEDKNYYIFHFYKSGYGRSTYFCEGKSKLEAWLNAFLRIRANTRASDTLFAHEFAEFANGLDNDCDSNEKVVPLDFLVKEYYKKEFGGDLYCVCLTRNDMAAKGE